MNKEIIKLLEQIQKREIKINDLMKKQHKDIKKLKEIEIQEESRGFCNCQQQANGPTSREYWELCSRL